jgi:hypothetical protein
VEDPSLYFGLTLRLARDDGGVVYLNGTEVFRSNMPTGTITYTTQASSTGSASTFVQTTVNPSLLLPGENVLAVEIHQASPSSSDISFDLELIGGTSPTVSITATDAIASEPGTNTGTFTVSRTGSTSASLTVTYTAGGTATSGSDYTALAGSVTIPAGAASATLTVTLLDNTVAESAETVIVMLTTSDSLIFD